MTTYTVISNADSGAGTLRSDLGIAQAGDIINFAPNVQLISVASPLEIKTNVTIEGSPSAAPGTRGVIVTGNSTTREFTIDGGVSTKLDGLELSYGYGKGFGANPMIPFSSGTTGAGAIYDRGTLTLSNSLIDHNTGKGYDGYTPLYAGGGAGGPGVGAIFVASGGTLNLVGSTNAFAANTGVGGTGGQGSSGLYDPTTTSMEQGGAGGSGARATSGATKQMAGSGYAGYGKGGGAGGGPYQAGQDGTGDGGSGGGGGGNAFADYAGPGTINVVPVCFASGTQIRTTRGDVAVEDLAVGDLVVTASGFARPIRWLGHRTIDCRRYPDPRIAWPVRIAAHAFGPDRPARDLLVSPGHSICIDVAGDVLVPAHVLVDDLSIVQLPVETVAYWHIELDTHDILLAENLPVESYLEMGNRAFFTETCVVSLDAGPDATFGSPAGFCRPFHASGVVVDALRARLHARSLRAQAEALVPRGARGGQRAG